MRFSVLETFFPKQRWARITPVAEDGFKGEWVTAPESSQKRVVLYIHGGGFVFNGTKLYRNFIAMVAKFSRAKVFSLDYSLAPENPYPTALNEALAAYKWLVGEYDAHSIAIAADSAGGTLALSLLHTLRDQELPLPACAVLLSPATDAMFGGESLGHNETKDIYISLESLRFFTDAYFAKTPKNDPIASPLHGSFKNFPPLLIHAEKTELMYSDSHRLAQKAEAAGVDVAFEPAEGLFHVWHLFALYMPEAKKSVQSIGEYIFKHTKINK
jgi:acetyl esterase/lipase